MILKLFILICGAFACSTSVIFIKASTENALLVAAYRLFVATFVLMPFMLRDLKRLKERFSLKLLRPSIAPGLVLGLHLITWIIGARMTLAAHSTLDAQSIVREALTIAGRICVYTNTNITVEVL